MTERPNDPSTTTGDVLRVADAGTLDDIFRSHVRRTPDVVALADPPDRTPSTDGAPRRLTCA
jgi:hypothetical protein